MNINLEEFRDKVYGCWMGKNIGGTLGAPFEGSTEVTDIDFYAQDLAGDPAPNDDLDLQLVWLNMAERHGLFNLTPRLFGDYWASFIIGPWNEYSVAHYNIRNGFYPPMSGAVNNDHWKFSNGAWIRSEIWACLCPGNPDEAIQYAYMDACCDHCGEGIYAEMYTAALESAAFVVKDLRKLIAIGLSKIPQDCRVAKCVKVACDCYDKGIDWKAARQAVLDATVPELGWFQAPANVAFATIGLLYGEGDFGKAVCTAVNCGDDTDCTGATTGAIMGIMLGKKGIPKKWLEPIGEKILTCAVNKFGLVMFNYPQTIKELTNRTVRLAQDAQFNNLEHCPLTDKPTEYADDDTTPLMNAARSQEIISRTPYYIDYPLTNATLRVVYDTPAMEPGVPAKVRLEIRNPILSEGEFSFRWILPEGWSVDKPQAKVSAKCWIVGRQDFVITPGAFTDAIMYINVDVRIHDRNFPNIISIPFQLKDSITYLKDAVQTEAVCEDFERVARRMRPLLGKMNE